MYVRQVRKVKINLWLLIFITIFIVAIIFTAIHFINSSKANTDESLSEYTSISKSKNNKNSSDNLDIGKDTFNSFNTIDENLNNDSNQTHTLVTQEPESNTINFNNHSYVFDKNDHVELLNDNAKQYIKLDHNGYTYRINTDAISFSDVKNQDDLKATLNQKYKINITSDIKAGNYNDLDLILGTISENDALGYFIITPLNENEIVFIEIYNSIDTSKLISDLTDPLNDISTKIKTSIQ
ncbi:MAG: hypothetical protein J6J36_05010 [Clostridia bacterium]|nr:hypothetical protein [Clostridia bacterium]